MYRANKNGPKKKFFDSVGFLIKFFDEKIINNAYASKEDIEKAQIALSPMGLYLDKHLTKKNTDKKDFFKVEISDPKVKDRLYNLLRPFRHEDKKIAASLRGDSKRAKKANNLILNIKPHYDDDTGSFIFASKDIDIGRLPFLKKKKLIIIENKTNFFYSKNLESIFPEIDLKQYNILLGQGDNITAQCNTKFLNSYNEVICYFDLDYASLSCFLSLKKTLNPSTNLSFPLNEKMKDLSVFYGKKLPEREKESILSIRNKSNKHIVDFLIEKDIKVEQEVFLKT